MARELIFCIHYFTLSVTSEQFHIEQASFLIKIEYIFNLYLAEQHALC